ncbi:MAG TPA: type IV pilus secretin PilQ [Candidatus Competibacteraceae bacterium]|nr:type IV pilus secretin PilQ [Candidatus Competibacteraceae bacterium]
MTSAVTKRLLSTATTPSRKLVGLWGVLLLALTWSLWLSPPAQAQAQAQDGKEQAVLQAVDVTTLPGNRVQLRFQFSQPAQTPRNFTISDPARVVLDFMNTRSGLSTRQQTIGTGVAERISVLEGNDRTRASINLAKLVPYSVRTQGNAVLLTLEAGAAASAAAAPTPSTIQTVATSAGRPAAAQISNIDFRRSAQGAAVIGIQLSTPNVNVDVREEGNQIVVNFRGVTLPREQERRLDVTDFATPVTLVDASNQNGNARIAIQPTGRYEYLAYQADTLYTVEVKPVQPEEEETTDPEKKKYTGDLLSLNFQDIEVRAVLQIIADFTGLNVVVSDTVQGNLTLRLQNVPWDQALDIILTTKGLTSRQNGNVIYIAPTEEITARERLELESRKQVVELVPTRTEIIQVNYAKAEDLAKLIKERSVGGGQQSGAVTTGIGGTLLSARGSVSVDSRTNTLLVNDIPDKISEIRRLVSQLDRPVRQVMIDSRIVIANDDFSKELGVRYGFAGVAKNGDSGVISATGSAEGNNVVVNSAINNIRTTGQPFPTTVPSLNQRLGINLPVAGPTTRIALAILGQDYLLDLELSALQAEGRGEILSNPRVLTTDHKKATIKQGQEVGYPVVGEDGTVTVAFKEALLELDVIPQITPDNRVIMDLKVTKNEITGFVSLPNGTSTPQLARRETETQVLVNNGETVVLGGVFEQITRDNKDKVPFLGDLPAIGRLFQKKVNQNNKLELLIFVTPQVVTEGVAQR